MKRNKSHELITVKEFAKRQSISEQAVYKSKKLKEYTVKENGITLIDFTRYTEDLKQPNNQPNNQLPTNEQPTVESTELGVVLAVLREQLTEKDKQIERLQTELSEIRQSSADEKEKLLALLDREQQANRNNQLLIASAQEKIALPPERKGLFSRWKKRDSEEIEQ